MTFFHFAASVLPLLTVSGGEALNSLDKTAGCGNTLSSRKEKGPQGYDDADAATPQDEIVGRILKGARILYDH